MPLDSETAAGIPAFRNLPGHAAETAQQEHGTRSWYPAAVLFLRPSARVSIAIGESMRFRLTSRMLGGIVYGSPRSQKFGHFASPSAAESDLTSQFFTLLRLWEPDPDSLLIEAERYPSSFNVIQDKISTLISASNIHLTAVRANALRLESEPLVSFRNVGWQPSGPRGSSFQFRRYRSTILIAASNRKRFGVRNAEHDDRAIADTPRRIAQELFAIWRLVNQAVS